MLCGLFAGAASFCPAQDREAPADGGPEIVERLGQVIRERLADLQALGEGDVVLLVSPEAQHLLKSAADAMDRRDWKVAIDALQRIAAEHGGELLTAEGNLYESGSRCVKRLLAGLPPEGLAAYRVLNDGEAAALLARARQDHDVNGLRAVVDRYLLTRVGDEAADLLATWLLEERRPGEALAVLDDLQQLHPDCDVPSDVLAVKRAVAAALLGERPVTEPEPIEKPGATGSLPARALADKPPVAPQWGYRDRLLAPGSVPGRARSLPPEWRQDVADLAVAATTPSEPTGAGTGDRWVALMGGGRNLGHMPPVEPSLVDVRSWRAWLDVGAVRVAPEDGSSDLPHSYPLVAGSCLMVRTADRLVGFDLETMQRVWEAPRCDRSLPMLDYRGFPLRSDHREELNRSAAVVGELVIYLDPGGQSVSTESDAVLLDPQEAPADRRRGLPVDPGNRLVAFDPRAGTVRWSRGRSNTPGDALSNVTFRGPPVLVGDEVVALYERGAQLVLGRLDPQGGKLLAEKALCGVPADPWTADECLPVTVADGLIVVPTGRGSLLAVNAHDLSLRWACRYGGRKPTRVFRQMRPTDEDPPVSGWALCPPVVSADTILLATRDADQLLAFDRRSGRLLWRRPREGFNYIAAADRDTGWLVGTEVAALALVSGERRWTRSLPPVTGRAALCGDTLYVPTRRGLEVFGAGDGEPLATLRLPVGQAPPGNLLAAGAALFSVDERQVRKFPDLGAGYARTRDALGRNPGDVSLAVRLAWLELLRDAPASALAALDALPEGNLTEILRRMHVDQLRVRSLLQLAEDASEDLERTEVYLRRAADLAKTRAERMETDLALARLTARRADPVGAFERFLTSVENQAAVPVRGDGSDVGLLPLPDGRERHVYGIVREELAALGPYLSQEQAAKLRSTLAARLHEAGDRRDYAALELYAELDLPFGLGPEAAVRLGQWEVEDERYEVAAAWFRSAADHAGGLPQTGWAMAELADLYLRPEVYSPASVVRVAERLLAEFPEQARAGEWESRLDREDIRKSLQTVERREDQVPAEPVWKIAQDGARRVYLLNDPSDILKRTLLWSTEEDRLVCSSLEEDRRLWEASLRWDRQRAGGEPTGSDAFFDPRFGRVTPVKPPVPAVSEDLILIARGPDGVHAVGAATGRAIWFRSSTGVPLHLNGVWTSNLAHDRGLIAFVPWPGMIEAVRATTGRTVWRREEAPSEASVLWMADGRLLALSEDWTRVHVFDAADGSRRRTLSFDQPQDRVDLIAFGGTICGPTERGVSCYDLDTGQLRWGRETEGRLVRLLEAGPNLLGIEVSPGQVEFLDAQTGRMLLRVPPEWVGRRLVDAAVTDGVACVLGQSSSDKSMLSAFRLDTGERLWGLPSLGDVKLFLFPGWLTDSPHLMFLMVKHDRPAEYRLITLDKQTGRKAGRDWRIPLPTQASTGPWLQWYPGRLVISNGESWWVYSTEPWGEEADAL